MPVIGFRIVKQADFEGSLKEFGNTYHYDVDPAGPPPDQEIAEELAAAEKAVTCSWANFVRWESWGPTDGPDLQNVMREQGDLTGPGQANDQNAYREVCSLIVFPLPRAPVTNVRRWCRKFGRGMFGTNAASIATLNGTDPLSQLAIDEIQLFYGERVRELTAASQFFNLCTEDGTVTNGPSVVRPFLITREIGR